MLNLKPIDILKEIQSGEIARKRSDVRTGRRRGVRVLPHILPTKLVITGARIWRYRRRGGDQRQAKPG